MAKKVSMADIANKVGISKYSVSLALRGLPGVSENTRLKILDTAEKMGYEYSKPSNSKNTKSICLILEKSAVNTNDFFHEIQIAIEKECASNNLNCIIASEDENPIKLPICITDNLVSGVLCLGRTNIDYYKNLCKYNLPIVLIDHYFKTVDANCILTDNISGAYNAVKFLIQNGHKNIMFYGDIYSSPSYFDRWLGFIKALKSFNLLTSDSTVCSTSKPALILSNYPSAVFCCNDVNAIELIKYFSENNIKVPEDISVIGFDNIEYSKMFVPELSTINVKKEEMGKKAVKRLIYLIHNTDESKQTILIPTFLVKRNSVKALVNNL